MTVAICIRCGHEKLGAFTTCKDCHFTPELWEDKAKALTLSDHINDIADLRRIGERIKSGEPFRFDESQIAAMAAELPKLPEPKMPLGCQIAIWTPIVVMLLLIIVLIALFVYIRMA